MTHQRKIKILFTLSSMYIGGVEKSLIALLRSMPEDRFDIHVGLARSEGAYIDKLPAHVKVFEIPEIASNRQLFCSPQKAVLKYLGEGRIKDALHYTVKYIKAIRKSSKADFYRYFLSKTPQLDDTYDIAVSFQGPSELFDYYISNHVKSRLRFAWIHFDISQTKITPKYLLEYYRKMDRIFTVSETARKRFSENFPSLTERVFVFPNIIQADEIRTLAKDNHERVQDMRTEGKLNILTIGRMHYAKGQDIAIMAAKRLKDMGVDFVWRFIGGGETLTANKKLAESLNLGAHVIFEGAKSNPYPYLAAADVYMQPSRNEGFCITIGEAKVFGLPIVSTDFAGAYDQLSTVKNATILNGNTPEEIADAIITASSYTKSEPDTIIPDRIPFELITEPFDALNR